MDHKLTFDEQKITRLRDLATGSPEGPFRDLVLKLTGAPENYTTKNLVLAEFRRTLTLCVKFGPDAREALADSLEEILEIFGIDSSDGLLNEWLHGISL